MKKLAVFLSSGEPNFHIKSDLDQIANFLAEQKICLLYGGGKLGLMGYLSQKTKEYNGYVEGVTVDMFDKKKYTPDYIDSLEVETNFYDRKRKLNDHSDAFLILPGGIGTADEFFDVLNLASLGLITKKIIVDKLLTINDFYKKIKTVMVVHDLNKYSDISKIIIFLPHQIFLKVYFLFLADACEDTIFEDNDMQ